MNEILIEAILWRVAVVHFEIDDSNMQKQDLEKCLIVRLQGGLGNQMFQYALGRSVALQTSRALYFEQHRLKRDKQRQLMLQAFYTKIKFASAMDRFCLKAMRKKAYYWPAFSVLKSLHGFQMQYLREQSIQYNPQIFELQGNLILDAQ